MLSAFQSTNPLLQIQLYKYQLKKSLATQDRQLAIAPLGNSSIFASTNFTRWQHSSHPCSVWNLWNRD
ncbi:MAG: hypothetical protein KA716_30870 [Gloeotrichia echinulata DEX184]|nr:hypothetical protein [Gloeotrichia echinulata DEX184]